MGGHPRAYVKTDAKNSTKTGAIGILGNTASPEASGDHWTGVRSDPSSHRGYIASRRLLGEYHLAAFRMWQPGSTIVRYMAQIHMSEAELAKDLHQVLEEVQRGTEVVVEHDHKPVAVLLPVVPPRRKISAVLALMPKYSVAKSLTWRRRTNSL